jgi:hypothetical protein
LVAGTAHADVIVHLQSGSDLRAVRTWTEGDLVKIQLRSGVVAFRADQIVKIEQAGSAAGSVATTSKPTSKTTTEADVDAAQAPDADKAPVVHEGAKPPPLKVEEHVQSVPGEDLQAKMERLDGLSMKTHRELSVARTQGQSQETLEALQHKIDEINQQRAETTRKLQGMR